jgi:mono/diheme cytochrome c family protein
MPDLSYTHRRPLRLRKPLLALLYLVPTAASAAPDHPVVPGFERFFSDAKSDAARGGQLLLGELNCISCHKPEGAALNALNRKEAPILDGVASRVRKSYLRKFLADPAAVKPGTFMPHLLAGFTEAQRMQKVEELTHFLASTGVPAAARAEPRRVGAGRELYHRVGCVACHGSRDDAGDTARTLPTSVPLGDLKAKYTLVGLAAFLQEPHRVRPSGRMPGLLLSTEEARAVANYLLQGVAFPTEVPNLTYAYYEGDWHNVPDFDKFTPTATGRACGFDLELAHRPDNYALRFEGYLRIDREAEYLFHLVSDDGSKLWIDGKEVVDNDGEHAPTAKSAKASLKNGMHKIVVGFFQLGGGATLDLQIEGPGLGVQAANPRIFLTPQGNPKPKPPPRNASDDDNFAIDAKLAAKGREAFVTLGCASCHQLHMDNKPLQSRSSAPPLARFKPQGGCLAEAPAAGLPLYRLSAAQRSALAAALRAPSGAGAPPPREVIAHTLTAFNCYACHQRDKVGGHEEAFNSFFVTTQPEMGDEGRVPPPLDGVGAKISTGWLDHIWAEGAKDRPYMYTRMPRFGAANVAPLTAALEAVDRVEPVTRPAFTETPAQVKAAGRHLVGGNALACVKCHIFNGHKAEGVQGIDMTLMPRRLKRDWFFHYIIDPQKYRPGTRMPEAWPKGESLLPAILGGDTIKQIESVWQYLSEGERAQLPRGLEQQSILLVPQKEAILYRNFIEGSGPRAIGVGYPEKANLAFDANDLRLSLLWQGDFIDAARHWTDRGAGFQGPAGDNILHLPSGPGIAVLEKPDEPWPTRPSKELGFHFRGYRLTSDERPTFLYSYRGLDVEDFPNAIAGKLGPSIRRTLTLKASQPVHGLYYRAVAGDKIEDVGDGWYRIHGEWKLHIETDGRPLLRDSAGKKELLVPILFRQGKARVVQEYSW